MNLEYKVLWCEDIDEWRSDLLDDVTNEIQEATCLIPKFVPISHPSQVSFDQLSSFDLFLLDYNYDTDTTGADLIQKIRENKVFTNVLLYSAASNLSQTEPCRGLEGVFFSSRDKRILLKKIRDVSFLSIKRSLDLNAIRGMFLSAVSDMEVFLDEVLVSIFNANHSALEEEKLFTKDDIIAKISQCHRKIERQTQLIKSDEFNFPETLKKPGVIDLTKKAEMIGFLIKNNYFNASQIDLLSKFELSPPVSFRKKFSDEVIKLRNKSAHVNVRELSDVLEDHVHSPADISEADRIFSYYKFVVQISSQYLSFCEQFANTFK